MIKDIKEWSEALRSAVQEPAATLQQRNGHWQLKDRKAAWFAAGPRIFDDDLARLRAVAVQVLTERDPQFELEPDDRLAARMRGKALKHSADLRRGLAETLALSGIFPEALTNASFGLAQITADGAVRDILKNADWQLWAGLSDQHPLLAEAAPEQFLTAVETGLRQNPSPFVTVYVQERGGAFGRTYFNGLLWALEGLAWSEEYLTRVVVILGGLARLDPGGQWTNRPSNSLTEILLPWLPHTTAPADKRVGTVKALLRNHPEVGWHLLLSLLPNSHRTSSETHKPTWRKLIPDTWERSVTNKEYWEESEAYALLALEHAQAFPRLLALVKRVADLPPIATNQLAVVLRARSAEFDPAQRQEIWNELLTTAARHKKFAHADWAMPADRITDLEALGNLFKPVSPLLEFNRLFGRDDFELYEEAADFPEQERKLIERRTEAAAAIFAAGGADQLIAFARDVEAPWQLGFAAGRAGVPSEPAFLPALLTDAVTPEANLVRGFVWARFHAAGWAWVDQLGIDRWPELPRAQLLAILPFGEDTWTRAERLLPDAARLFWERTDANPYRARTGLDPAIRQLLDRGRPFEAIVCLYYQVHERQQIDEVLAVRALRALLENPKLLERSRATHDVIAIIKALQVSPRTRPEDLFQIEWSYLALLDNFTGGSPLLLSQKLATEPAFFCEIIRLLYRSKNEPPKDRVEVDEARKRQAENGYKLLHNWRRVPGRGDDGSLDAAVLQAWVAAVEKSCRESGHLEVAQTHLGHVLKYAPPDPSGLWIHKAAAEILDAEAAEEVRSGYHCEWFNSRGAYWGTGGSEELKLAAGFKERAASVEAEGFVRLGTALRELAKSYEHQAARDASGAL